MLVERLNYIPYRSILSINLYLNFFILLTSALDNMLLY